MKAKLSVLEWIERLSVNTANFLHISETILLLQKRKLILMYHSVNGENPQYHYEIMIENFLKQLQFIRQHFEIVTIEQLFRDQKQKKSQVALSFDDAYEDFYLNVFPILKQHQLPATLFLPTALISTEPVVEIQNNYLYNKRHVTWNQVIEMHASGLIEIGSHTHSHLDMKENIEQFEEDVLLSIRFIEENIGQRPKLFAYPYGSRTKEMDAIIQKHGFKFAVMSKSQSLNGQLVEGRIDIYRRNQTMPYFKLTIVGLINSDTKDVYRKLRSAISR
jgi:peptidoglycan/xylan/chitin deacetylase (PgdA/CDA1 family)